MRQHDVAYLPTLQAVASIAEYFHGWKPGDPPTAEMQQAAQAFRLAMAAGVSIGVGSDVGVFRHGDNYRELEQMVGNGMSPPRAGLAATAIDARNLRRQDSSGQTRAGRGAERMAVRGEPTAEKGVAEQGGFGQKGGGSNRKPK